MTIGRDVLLAGQTVSLAGNVAGNVRIAGKNVMIDAQIQGDLALLLSRDSTPILGPNAVISGKIEYTSSVRHPELDALPNTTYIQDQDAFAMTPMAPMFMNFFIAYLIYRFFSLFIIGSALFFIFQKFFLKTGAFFIKSPWKSLLYGALFYLILPLVSVILLCTIIGIPL